MKNIGPILLIEDDPEDQLLIKEALESLQIQRELVIKANGQEGLDYLTSIPGQPFLILCDINMPRINGLQLRDLIHANPELRRKSIPFVFLSTAANRNEVNQAYDLTVQGFFKKHSDFKSFVDDLKCIISYWEKCLHPNSI
jgi:CheY-like chemotaxis protein